MGKTIGGENRKIKWVEGGKARRPRQVKAEEHLGLRWGEVPPLFPSGTYFSPSPSFGDFLGCPPAVFRTAVTFPRCLGD